MAGITDSGVLIADYLKQLLEDHAEELGLQDVWYGDQNKLPRTPCAVVEAGPKSRIIQGSPRRSIVQITTIVTVYWGAVRDIQANSHDADTLGEAVETLFHSDPTLGSTADGSALVIHSLVTSFDPGVANKGGTLVRGTRLTHVSDTQVQLPNNLGI